MVRQLSRVKVDDSAVIQWATREGKLSYFFRVRESSSESDCKKLGFGMSHSTG